MQSSCELRGTPQYPEVSSSATEFPKVPHPNAIRMRVPKTLRLDSVWQTYICDLPTHVVHASLVNPLSELEKIRKSMTLLENHFRFSQNSSSTGMAGGSPADVLPMRAVSLALSEARTFIGSVADEVSQLYLLCMPTPMKYATVSRQIQSRS